MHVHKSSFWCTGHYPQCHSYFPFFIFYFLDCLLHTDRHPLHRPCLLHRAHREPTEEENSGGKDQTEEGGVRGPVCCRRFLHLLPALCCSPSGAAERQAKRMAGGRGHRGSGLRQPYGSVVHGLPTGPAGLLLL